MDVKLENFSGQAVNTRICTKLFQDGQRGHRKQSLTKLCKCKRRDEGILNEVKRYFTVQNVHFAGFKGASDAN